MTYVKGIDLNRYRGKVDFNRIRDQGYVFCATRITVGNYCTDPTYDANLMGAHDAGLLTTGYHVVNPTISSIVQMNYFKIAIGGFVPDLPWVLDCELTGGLTRTAVSTCVRDCIALTPLVRQHKPILYLNQNFGDNYLNSTYNCFLWIADPDPVSKPDMPAKWQDWLFWQYSWTGTPAGIENPPCDLDYAHFDCLNDLRVWAGLDEMPTLEQRVASLEDRVTKLEGKLL